MEARPMTDKPFALKERTQEAREAYVQGWYAGKHADMEYQARMGAPISSDYVIVPTKNATHAIVGHAPLNLEGVEGGKDEFAVYIDGLTADEAGALMRLLMTPKKPV
jgi:hypothetical protein